MNKKRIQFNTPIDESLLKRLKILAIEKNSRLNDLLEQAIEDFLKKNTPKNRKNHKASG
jgi:hypothetical protein